MSRTERTRLIYDWEADRVRLNPNGRDDKQRCECCGNTYQKMYNRRERRTAKHAIARGEEPDKPRPGWY